MAPQMSIAAQCPSMTSCRPLRFGYRGDRLFEACASGLASRVAYGSSDVPRLMQMLHLETVDGNVRVKELIERLANLDGERQDRMIFEDTENGWHEAA